MGPAEIDFSGIAHGHVNVGLVTLQRINVHLIGLNFVRDTHYNQCVISKDTLG